MKSIAAVIVVLSCVAAPTFAGPIRESAARQTPAPAAPDAKPKAMVRKNPDLYWGGIAMAGIGGWMLGTGLGQQHTIVCGGGSTLVACEETGANKGMLIGVGAGVMGAGIVLSAIGGQKVAVSPTRQGVLVRSRLTF
jgi:hypothetical protein